MGTPIRLPDIGAEGRSVRVSLWLVDPGDRVEEGDRVVEVLLDGMTFDVATPISGILSQTAMPVDAVVEPGDVLGWIEPILEDFTE